MVKLGKHNDDSWKVILGNVLANLVDVHMVLGFLVDLSFILQNCLNWRVGRKCGDFGVALGLDGVGKSDGFVYGLILLLCMHISIHINKSNINYNICIWFMFIYVYIIIDNYVYIYIFIYVYR